MAQHPRPAATVALLRQGAGGPEVFMLQRTQNAAFLGGAYVFPGGALDKEDGSPRALARVRGLDDANASARLKLPAGGLAYWVAAVRECFEEAGILVVEDAQGRPITPARAESLQGARNAPFLDLLEKEDLYIPANALAYHGHWITAPNRPRRFDTRFFVAIAPDGQDGSNDASETVHDVWITPAEALARGARGEIELVHATEQTLKDLGRFSDVHAAFEYVRALPEIDTNRACWAQGKDGPKVFRRTDAPYFEIHWSDPEETGATTYDLTPGVPKRLDERVVRVIAPNPGAMTGPGTNSYIVGQGDLAIIDPGPAIDSHVEALLRQTQARLRWILCTHTHMDHSPAARALQAATGATVYGRAAPAGQDASFAPDVIVEDGQRIELGGTTLRALHTPGHASNHVCYLLEQTRMLFTGDHVMQGSTVVINPPDGDMRAYLRSLERLLEEDIAILAPGHGYLIGAPHREVRRLIAHRMNRETKVVHALRARGAATLEDLVPAVYDDVPERMHRWAARSLTAHLDKLVAERRVRADAGRYTLVQSPQVAQETASRGDRA